MFYKIYLDNNYLIIESFFLKEKIKINSIDDIVILHDRNRTSHKLFMYFSQPIEFSIVKASIFYKGLLKIYLFFNVNRFQILRRYDDQLILKMCSLLQSNLQALEVPSTLDDSFLWRTTDDGMVFKKIKLIYSKNNLGLKQVLLKRKILITS